GLTNITTFTPASNLSMLTPYTARLTTAITDLSGNPLATNYDWSFVTEDGAWGSAGTIESDDTGEAWSPQIDFDANGNAIAVWYQHDGTRTNIWANRYVSGTGWGTPELIETDNAGWASYPQVAVDVIGNAIAVWVQHDGTRKNTWANRYVVGTGWGTAELIEFDNAGKAMRPQLAVDASGNAIAVWVQNDGTRNNILGNHYTAGSGWGTAGYLEFDNGMASWPQVAVQTSNGNALVVWQQHDGTRNNIWGNRYTAGSGWGGMD
ncbi:MAG: Ig-like domain-containing protein, partial [Gammaproteobacteria bacterium]|nr:Ig-like domain-containing protein [Gammaproteobacteria bacterium]